MSIADRMRQHLIDNGVSKVGVGITVLLENIRLDVGTMVALPSREAALELILLHKACKLDVLLGILMKEVQYKMIAATKTSADAGDGWQTVKKTTKLARDQLQRLIGATGLTVGQLSVFALQVTAALANGPITIPMRTLQETEIMAGLRTEPMEEWAALCVEDINDIRRQLHDLQARGNMIPLLLQILIESESNMVQYADDEEDSPSALTMILQVAAAEAGVRHEDHSEDNDDGDVQGGTVDTLEGSVMIVQHPKDED
eukprot:2209176-Rhodomonas_salina.2